MFSAHDPFVRRGRHVRHNVIVVETIGRCIGSDEEKALEAAKEISELHKKRALRLDDKTNSQIIKAEELMNRNKLGEAGKCFEEAAESVDDKREAAGFLIKAAQAWIVSESMYWQ